MSAGVDKERVDNRAMSWAVAEDEDEEDVVDGTVLSFESDSLTL